MKGKREVLKRLRSIFGKKRSAKQKKQKSSSIDWEGNREQRFSAADDEDVGGVDWLDGSELETESPSSDIRGSTTEDADSSGPAGATEANPSTGLEAGPSPLDRGGYAEQAREKKAEAMAQRKAERGRRGGIPEGPAGGPAGADVYFDPGAPRLDQNICLIESA